MKIETLEQAKGQIVRCSDGYTRRLTEYDEEKGYYEIPITQDVCRNSGEVRIAVVKYLFIGGKIVSEF